LLIIIIIIIIILGPAAGQSVSYRVQTAADLGSHAYSSAHHTPQGFIISNPAQIMVYVEIGATQ